MSVPVTDLAPLLPAAAEVALAEPRADTSRVPIRPVTRDEMYRAGIRAADRLKEDT